MKSAMWSRLKMNLVHRGIDTVDLIGSRGMVVVDSAIADKEHDSRKISDPYATLRGCTIFAIRASGVNNTDSNARIVVMWNNDSVWISDPFAGGFGGIIDAVMDINNDSTVDILSEWTFGSRQDQKELWIHSWNGVQARVINDTSGGYSKLEAAWFEFVPSDHDGILDIKAIVADYDLGGGGSQPNGWQIKGSISYKWNGKKYIEVDPQVNTNK
jgi:hypothetical protein